MSAQRTYSWVNRLWQDVAGTDLRSLALFRVMLALAVLINAALYWPDIAIFFADETGFFLRPDVPGRETIRNWSLLYLSGESWFLYAFLTLYTLSGLALFFGYRTRAATALCWVCSVSLKNRASMFISLADVQLSVLLFWAMFLPLGARLSIDSALNRRTQQSNQYASIASIALILNVAYLYFFGALEKTGDSWTANFDAVYYALTKVENTTPLAPYFLMIGADALRAMTGCIYYLELIGPLLLFLPKYTQASRMIVVPLLMFLHIGFMLTLSIGIFPLVSLAGLCALLPAIFWDRPLAAFNRRKKRTNIAIYYDRGCDFCLKLCLIFRALGLPSATPVLIAQEDETAGPMLEKENSWVVKTHSGSYLTKWDAVAYLCRRSPLLFPLGLLFALPGFKQLGNAFYLLIAHLRPRLAALTKHLLPFSDKPTYRPGKVVDNMLAILALLVLISHIYTIAGWRMPDKTTSTTLRSLGLNQRWNMYARPSRYSNWLVMEGTLADGTIVDAQFLKNAPPSHARPHDGWDMFSHFRWRKFFSRVKWDRQGPRIAHYYCERWKKQMGAPLSSITIHSYRQYTAAPGEVMEQARVQRVYSANCNN